MYPKIPLVTHLPFYREDDRAVDSLHHSGPPESLFKDSLGGGNSALSTGSVAEASVTIRNPSPSLFLNPNSKC